MEKLRKRIIGLTLAGLFALLPCFGNAVTVFAAQESEIESMNVSGIVPINVKTGKNDGSQKKISKSFINRR